MSDLKFSSLVTASYLDGTDYITLIRTGSATSPNTGTQPNNYLAKANTFTASYSQKSISSSISDSASYFKFTNISASDGNFSGFLQVASSSIFNGGITSSKGFYGTASWASQSLSSSYMVPGTYNFTSSNSVSSSYALTSSYSLTNLTSSYSLTNVSSSYSLTSSFATSALTASYIRNLYVDAVPIGTVMPFASSTAPTNWFECRGQEISTTAYSSLYSIIGTSFNNGAEAVGNFRLPNLQGEFVRGWDNSRGVDSGRAFASLQLDALQGHYHGLYGSNGSGGSSVEISSNGVPPSTNTDKVLSPVTDGTNGTPRTGSESRPRNIALMYCIKYTNALGLVDSGGTTLAGDVVGYTTASTVQKIQGYSVSSTAPTVGSILYYNGTNWVPTSSLSLGITTIQGPFSLPLTGSSSAYRNIIATGTESVIITAYMNGKDRDDGDSGDLMLYLDGTLLDTITVEDTIKTQISLIGRVTLSPGAHTVQVVTNGSLTLWRDGKFTVYAAQTIT